MQAILLLLGLYDYAAKICSFSFICLGFRIEHTKYEAFLAEILFVSIVILPFLTELTLSQPEYMLVKFCEHL